MEKPASRVVGPEGRQGNLAVVAIGLKSKHSLRKCLKSLDVSGVSGRNLVCHPRRRVEL
jgi:hypothetical protein